VQAIGDHVPFRPQGQPLAQFVGQRRAPQPPGDRAGLNDISQQDRLVHQ
jgi:hypothetical protein